MAHSSVEVVGQMFLYSPHPFDIVAIYTLHQTLD